MKKLIVVLALLLPTLALAKEHQAPKTPVAEITQFAHMMHNKYGFDEDNLKTYIVNKGFDPEILYHQAPPGYVRPTPEEMHLMYLKMVDDGVQFMYDHEETLKRAEADFGVPPIILTSLLGIETNYGTFQGRHKAVDTLITLGFYTHSRRTMYFRSELENLLVAAREFDWDLDNLVGSYAGAVGIPQFMPSNIKRLAVDYDGCGHLNLFSSPDDAIGSVGNYLHVAGWEPGKPVLIEKKHGYQRMVNFTVIKRYNPLNSYVLSITRLGRDIMARRATYMPMANN